MSRVRLTEWPRPVARERYDAAAAEMARALAGYPGMHAVYQVGSVGDPGISDIDLVAVFADGKACPADPRAGLRGDGRYVFAHQLFGASLAHWKAARRFPLFRDYRRVWGGSGATATAAPVAEYPASVRTQTALEYMLRLYLSLSVQLTLGVVKVRGLLLHLKAARNDLELLGLAGGPLHELTERVEGWRRAWFTDPPAAEEIVSLARSARHELGALLEALLAATPLYLPAAPSYRVSAGIRIRPAATFGLVHRGVVLPAAATAFWGRLFNLQHRFNTFELGVPIASTGAPAEVLDRRRLQVEVVAYNARHLPAFMPLLWPLRLAAPGLPG